MRMGQEAGNFGDLVLALLKSDSEQIPRISGPCFSYLLAILFDNALGHYHMFYHTDTVI